MVYMYIIEYMKFVLDKTLLSCALSDNGGQSSKVHITIM